MKCGSGIILLMLMATFCSSEESAPKVRPESQEEQSAGEQTLPAIAPELTPEDVARQKQPQKPEGPPPFSIGPEHDPVRIFARVDNSKPSIGDWVTYHLHVEGPEGIEFKRAELQGKLPDYLALRARVGGKQEKSEGRVSSTWEFTLDFFFSGKFPLPPIVVTYKGLDGKEKQILAPIFFLDIQDLPLDPDHASEIRPLKPATTIKVDYTRTYVIGACVIGGILLLTIGTFLFVRWLRKPEEVPRLPAHVIAYEQMRRLVEDQLLEQERIEEYYVRLSDICRHYLENRFGLQAPERTTEEFLLDMANTHLLTQSHQQVVRDFLCHCDLVKFAQYGPTEPEMREAFEAAKRLVDETREQDEEDIDIEDIDIETTEASPQTINS